MQDSGNDFGAAFNRLTKASEEGRAPRCLMPWQSLMIDVTGKVQPCAYRGNYTNTENAEPLGNLNEQTLEEIWNGPVAQRVRSCMASGDLEGAGCGKCLCISQGQALGLDYDLDAPTAPSSPYTANLALKVDEVLSGATVCESRPTVLYHTPDHRCNLFCQHCYQNLSRKASITNKDNEAGLLDLVPYLTRVVAGGGEPLILPFWRRFLASPAKEQNPHLNFSTTTNATILRDDVLRDIADFNKISIIISLDGATKKTFETIRRPAKWETFLENARKLRALCSEKRSFFSFNISTMKGNMRELPDFVRFCAEFEAPFNYQPVVAYPASQSLRCFRDPLTEMAGWKDAFDDARAALHGDLLPALRKAGHEGRMEWVESNLTVYEGHLSALYNLIPWDLLDHEYHLAQGSISADRLAWIKWLESGADSVRTGVVGSNVLFYREEAPPYSDPNHYAPLNEDLSFTALLPTGRWVMAVAPTDGILPNRSQAWGDQQPIEVRAPTRTGRWKRALAHLWSSARAV